MTKSSKIIAALGVIAGIGVASLPIGTFAADSGSADVNVKLTVSDTIAIGVDEADCTATATANDYKTCVNTVTYATNTASGATLAIKDKDTATSLVGSGTADGDTLTAGTFTVNQVGEGKWGYTGGTKTSITAITASAVTISTSSSATSTEVPVTFHFSTKATQKPGLYTDVVTYTAQTN